MYFRSPDPSGSRREEIRLPEHYGGCAFPRHDAVRESPIPTEHQKEEVNRSAFPTERQKEDASRSAFPTEREHMAEPPSSSTQGGIPALAPHEESSSTPRERPREKSRGLLPLGFGGLALDELLLLGLLLLLGKEGEDSEILLLLLLLLLCGG